MSVDSEQCSCGLAVEDRTGQAYNEGAFRHFLAIERARAHTANRSFLLLLVSLKKNADGAGRIPPAIATQLFAGLVFCVREVDFFGWYRHERVAGAVLTQGQETLALEVADQIADRVRTVLSERVPSSVAHRLQVRVLQLRRSGEC